MSGELDILLPANRRGTDILETIANLSSDEVFTPPWLVNEMLDMLEDNCPGIFSDPSKTFLDPACKTGIFLREIARRLFEGLKEVIPDAEERRTHILERQVYGIAITELTALMSRRTLYCSRDASGKYSAVQMCGEEGNVRFRDIGHTFDKRGKCHFCPARRELLGREERIGKEVYAYEFIHTDIPEGIFHMKFDVIIGNPPYHIHTGSDPENHQKSRPIYDRFVLNAIRMRPHYLLMITPMKWLSQEPTTETLRNQLIKAGHLRILHEFNDSHQCFPDNSVEGAVGYYLWDSSYQGATTIFRHTENDLVSKASIDYRDATTFPKDEICASIMSKVQSKGYESFSSLVASRKPYGLESNFFKTHHETNESVRNNAFIKVLGQDSSVNTLPADYPFPKSEGLWKYKLFIPKALGSELLWRKIPSKIISEPWIGMPGQACTESLLEVGPFDSEEMCKRCFAYVRTRFFRFMTGLSKVSQNMSKKTFSLVPAIPLDRRWDDQSIYSLFELSSAEISYIENLVTNQDEWVGRRF